MVEEILIAFIITCADYKQPEAWAKFIKFSSAELGWLSPASDSPRSKI